MSRRLAAALFCLVLATPGIAAASGYAGVLYAGGNAYPRVLRLADGIILAGVNTIVGGDGVGVVLASVNDGRTFRRIATIADPAGAGGAQECCASLYELPSAVGGFPAGTVLWVAGFGYGRRPVRIRLWASLNHGWTWRYVSDIAVAGDAAPLWEPSLSVAADGELVAFYSDETDKSRHDQKIVQLRSADAIHWTGYTETVATAHRPDRPGMAQVIRLANGSYFMTYEICDNDLKHLCSSYYRESPDGWNFGDPRNLGTVIRTADGKYFRHTPSVALSPTGTILLISEMVVNADGRAAPEDGEVLLGNDHDGAGPWYELPAPIAIPGAKNAPCRNFGSDLVPSEDGTSVLEVADDYDASGTCVAYYAWGSVRVAAG